MPGPSRGHSATIRNLLAWWVLLGQGGLQLAEAGLAEHPHAVCRISHQERVTNRRVDDPLPRGITITSVKASSTRRGSVTSLPKLAESLSAVRSAS